MRPSAALRWALPLVCCLVALPGCRAVKGSLETVGAALSYRDAPLPESQVELDIPYRRDDRADPVKHRLDLFLPDPTTRDWPTLIFVHGGGWTHGDRSLGVGSIRPMRNLGRYYAARGVGTAVISYRLQPGATWQQQVRDVAAAAGWVHRSIGDYGGDPDALYLAGHSAGAWLAARTGLDPEPLPGAGVPRSSLCGLVLISGAAYDLTDEETYALGANRRYFEERFGGPEGPWQSEASIVPLVDAADPPTLILYAGGEEATLRRQGELLYAAMRDVGAPVERVVVPGEDHQRILVAMSREDKLPSSTTLAMLDRTDCPVRR